MGSLFGFLTFVCLVLLVIGMFKPSAVLRGTDGTRGKVGLVYGLGFLGLSIIGSIVAPPPKKSSDETTVPTETVERSAASTETAVASTEVTEALVSAPQPENDSSQAGKALTQRLRNIQRLNSGIFSAQEEWEGQRLVMKWKPNANPERKRLVWAEIKNVLSNIERRVPDNAYKQIEFDMYVETVDRLGNKDQARAMILNFNWEEIKAAQWGNLEGIDVSQLVNRATVTRIGQELGRDWCATQIFGKDGLTHFCGTYIKGSNRPLEDY